MPGPKTEQLEALTAEMVERKAWWSKLPWMLLALVLTGIVGGGVAIWEGSSAWRELNSRVDGLEEKHEHRTKHTFSG